MPDKKTCIKCGLNQLAINSYRRRYLQAENDKVALVFENLELKRAIAKLRSSMDNYILAKMDDKALSLTN